METESRKTNVTIVPLDEKWFNKAEVPSVSREHLLSSLASLERGMITTPSFKLYGRDDVELVRHFLDKLPWDSFNLPEGVKEYEYSRLEKFGAQGGYRPWSEMRDLFHLYQTRLSPCTVDLEILKMCQDNYKDIMCQMLSIDMSLAKLVASDKIQDRAAGCRFFNLKKTDPVAQKYAIRDFKSHLYKEFFMYTFARYYKNKIRLFMPGPFSSMIDQARFVYPFLTGIQQSIKAKGINSKLIQHADKIGFENCFKLMGEEINAQLTLSELQKGSLVYCQGDFEKMDTTTGPDQYQSLFIPCMASSFRYSEKSYNYYQLSESMLYTTNMPIASPDGMMVGDHGTGSGMNNTNIGEGVCNDYYQMKTIDNMKILISTMPKYSTLRNIKWKCISRRVNGDDSAYVFWIETKDPDILALFKDLVQLAAEKAAKECGFIINDKWRISTSFGLFCQNIFYYDINERKIKWFYPLSLILNSIMNPEHQYKRADWDKDYRDIDVTEKLDNGEHHPGFTYLVKFVDNGMKFKLYQHDEKALHRILSKYDKYKALQPVHERWNRQDYDITRSATIKYVMGSLR